ncbi:MAG: hypothetical protein ACKKL6_00260 [Candidatus Komeilibacteria bacterium]
MNFESINAKHPWGVNIGVDVDETMFPNLPIFIEWHNVHYGSEAVLNDFASYGGWNDVFNVSVATIVERYMDFMFGYYRGLNPDPFPGVEDALGLLKVDGARINAVSSRQSELAVITQHQILSKFADQRLVMGYSFGNKYSRDKKNLSFKEKWESCELMRVRLMIEDRVSDAESLAEHGIRVILFNNGLAYPWSVSDHEHDLIHVVSDWKEVYPLANKLVHEAYQEVL